MLPQVEETGSNENLPGYPLYPFDEDIYRQYKKEGEGDPEDSMQLKMSNENAGVDNEKEFRENPTGGNSDVPGSALDDDRESVGSEDEENKYNSLGDDDPADLEDDKTE